MSLITGPPIACAQTELVLPSTNTNVEALEKLVLGWQTVERILSYPVLKFLWLPCWKGEGRCNVDWRTGTWAAVRNINDFYLAG